MNKQLVQQVNATQIRNDIPDIRTGDKVRVRVTIRENNKERQQAFEGVVIAIRGAASSKTLTVRKVSAGVGVERNFLRNSPVIASVKVLEHSKVRRKKLYFLRSLSGKAARLTRVIDKKDAKLVEETVAKAEETPVAQEIKAAEAEAPKSEESK